MRSTTSCVTSSGSSDGSPAPVLLPVPAMPLRWPTASRAVRRPQPFDFGDLFAYAPVRRLGLPLLFKGDDFAQTDVIPLPLTGSWNRGGFPRPNEEMRPPTTLFPQPALMFAVKPLSSMMGLQHVPEVRSGWRSAWRAAGFETTVEQALMRGLATA